MTYPALHSLGINRPHEISSYNLSSSGDVDTLRIRYSRKKGSLLPTSKRFKFPRRPMPSVHVEPGQPLMTEISPALEEALEELSSLLSEDKTTLQRKAELLQEIDEFEDFIRIHLEEFRAEINQL